MEAIRLSTPVILALTRRATLCGLPYNAFIILLMSAYVTFIWFDHVSVTLAVIFAIYLSLVRLCSRDLCALDIIAVRLQHLGVYPYALKQHWGLRSYAPE